MAASGSWRRVDHGGEWIMAQADTTGHPLASYQAAVAETCFRNDANGGLWRVDKEGNNF